MDFYSGELPKLISVSSSSTDVLPAESWLAILRFARNVFYC